MALTINNSDFASVSSAPLSPIKKLGWMGST